MAYITIDENGDLAVVPSKSYPEEAQEMISSVKAHALERYADDAWDIVIECWNDDMIYAHIKDCLCDVDAIKRVSEVLEPYAADRRQYELERLPYGREGI